MKKTIRFGLVSLLIVSLILAITGTGFQQQSPEAASNGSAYYNAASPNENAIAELLVRQGKLSANATPEQVASAVLAYERKKLAVKPKSTTQIKKELLAGNSAATINSNLIYNRKNGVDYKGGSDIAPVEESGYGDPDNTAKLLVLLVEFGEEGPLHNQIPAPTVRNNSSFWVKDFSMDHYQGMLFTRGGYDAVDQNGNTLHLDSMTDYYLTQSNGRYEIDGVVYQWVKVPHAEAYYGNDNPDGGHDNMAPGTAKDLVADAVAAADLAGLDFSEFDNENPYGLVEGGYYAEDGIIDHLVLVHAGVDQSGGGGLQGDNAIWAHSSSVGYGSLAADGKYIYNYIIQGEDCGIGTFTHEYGHDLGLPDEYDTMYTGSGEPVGFWSLMSSGSWLGQPLDVKPSSISIWGRYALGWVEAKTIGLESQKVLLDQSVSLGKNEQALRINLPMQTLQYPAQPQSGEGMWFSGQGDEYVATVVSAPIDLTAAAAPVLSFKTWYEIEEKWDFAFVQASTNGVDWTSLASSRTTMDYDPDAMPEITENLPGYTGSSKGWVTDSIDLSSYKGQTVQLRFLYMTDWATSLTGIFFDDIKIVDGTNAILSENCDAASDWTLKNFIISNGTYQKNHYYIAEWRNFQKTDETLFNAYSFYSKTAATISFFSYQPGLLLWYRNMAYSDNWVGDHPGYGFLGVVDAHPQAMFSSNYKKLARTRVAIYDATFGRQPIEAQMINLWGQAYKLDAKAANPTFDDSKAYWYSSAPHAGLKVPNYGLKVQVTGMAKDMTVGQVSVSFNPVS